MTRTDRAWARRCRDGARDRLTWGCVVRGVAWRRSRSAVLVLAMLAVVPGCVERLLTIRTDPPGASIRLDGADVGTSPCEVPFEYYGQREVVARLEGYETRRQLLTIDPPWWQSPPFDLFSEVVDPRHHLVRCDLFLSLDPLRNAAGEEERLLQRAEAIRRRARADR